MGFDAGKPQAIINAKWMVKETESFNQWQSMLWDVSHSTNHSGCHPLQSEGNFTWVFTVILMKGWVMKGWMGGIEKNGKSDVLSKYVLSTAHPQF